MLIFTDHGHEKSGRQRFYTTNVPLTTSPRESYNLPDEFEYVKRKLKEECRGQLSDQISDKSFTCFCISDSHTHTERMVFLAARLTVKGKDKFYALIGNHLDGEMTMMTHGGSSSTVREYDYYLGRLAAANGYKKYEVTNERS